MKVITAYKCHWCDKVYEKNQSCKSHENRCYFNPKTFSCASCAYKIYGDYRMPDNSITSIRTCLLNIDITARLRTKCQNYISKVYPEANRYIQENKNSYFPDNLIMKHIEKIMRLPRFSDNENDEKERKTELSGCYYGMFISNLMVTIVQRMRFKIAVQKSDNLIESNFDLHSEFSKNMLSMFYHLGIENYRINTLLKTIPDLWNLEEVELDKIEMFGLFAILDSLSQINSLLLMSEKGSKLNEFLKSLDFNKLKDLVKKNHLSFGDQTEEYYLNFERFVKFVDPNFIPDLDRLITEIVKCI